MATTLSLNSDDTVFVTTFYGGPSKGRSYNFAFFVEGNISMSIEATFTEDDLVAMLIAKNMTDDRMGLTVPACGKPSADNRGPDVQSAEQLLDDDSRDTDWDRDHPRTSTERD